MSLTVCCVWVKANVPYGVEYVVNLRGMVARHLSQPHRFVCLTDRPDRLPVGIHPIAVELPKGVPGWWAKLQLFACEPLRDTCLYLDLDSVVVGSLDAVVDLLPTLKTPTGFPATIGLLPDGGTFKPRTAHKTVRRFNSSVILWTASSQGGAQSVLCRRGEEVRRLADEYWGDQDFIGYAFPSAAMLPGSWFPRLSELNGQPPGPDAKVVLAKKPKNHIAADLYPWVAQAWRAA